MNCQETTIVSEAVAYLKHGTWDSGGARIKCFPEISPGGNFQHLSGTWPFVLLIDTPSMENDLFACLPSQALYGPKSSGQALSAQHLSTSNTLSKKKLPFAIELGLRYGLKRVLPIVIITGQ